MASKVEGQSETAVVVAAVFIFNWVSAQYWGFPFVWCWGKQYLGPVVEPWFFLVHFAAIAYFLVSAWSLHPINIIRSLMVVIAVYWLPTFAEMSLRLGKSCS